MNIACKISISSISFLLEFSVWEECNIQWDSVLMVSDVNFFQTEILPTVNDCEVIL